MSLRKRIESALVVLLVVVAALALAPLNASATHYPDGARCYDCHAVSGSKMVSGTNMIKTSPFTTQLQSAGWVPGNPLPCVFCHRKDAVSVSSVTKMKPVDGHFTASVASKHDANFVTAFGTTYTAGDAFNCNHCHSGTGASITTGVVYQSASGDANVHNISAAGGTANVSLYGSLVNNGGTPNATTKAPHCLTTTCHGGASDQTIGGRTAKMDHAFAVADVTKPTVGGAFGDCSSCHATHRGEKQSSLMVLLNDGNVDAQDGTAYLASEYVTPSECDACHVQSKGTNQYVAKGHGNAAISGGSLTCTACHNENIPHVFGTGGSVANQLRFKFAENNTKTSSIRQDAVHDSAYSICLTCHAQFADKIHEGPAAVAGCNDCHEPHGTGVNTNVKMIRTQIPKVNVSGTPVYGDGSLASYDSNTYTVTTDASLGTGASLCDNAECHMGRTVNANLIYPLFSGATPLMASGRHTGGNLPSDGSANCEGCHTHTDGGGTFAATQSCTTCHGMPPTTTATTAPSYTTIGELNGPHKRHASAVIDGGYGIVCTACHQKYADGTWHNTGLWNNTTQTFGNAANASYQSIYFDTALNPASTVAAGSAPKDYSNSYNATTRVCSDMYCHSAGTTATTVNVKTTNGTGVADTYANNDAIAWTENSWSTANLACNMCHGGIDAGATQIATGAHTDHLINGVTCNNCHFGTITGIGDDTTMAIASTTLHVNKAKDVSSGGTYNSVAVSFTWNGTTCATVSCHGGWKTIAWTATDSCTNCHNYPPDNTIAGTTDHDATTGNGNITIAALKAAHGNCDTCHGVSSSNDVTPTAFGTPVDKTGSSGDAYVITTNHMDGKVQMNGVSVPNNSQNAGYNETAVACDSAGCHGNTYRFNGTVRANTVEMKELGVGSSTCGGCHTGGVRPAANSGAHAAHGVDATDLVAGGAACVDCHGNNGGLGFQIALAGTHGIGGAVNFSGVTYSTAVRNDLTGTCRTTNCHNRDTVADQSTAWNTTALACDDCHYYSLTPTLAGNNAHGRPLSATHNDHFTRSKTCQQCHGTDPVAGDTTHISGVTTLADKAVALQDEASLVWTHASAVTDYTFDDTGNTCYTATNSGLGCHASAGDAGAADPTRPDWDVAFADCTSYCHSNKTDTASNPTSGLHGVVPSITGEQHDESFAGATKGCADCHNVAALATHQNGAFTGNGSVAGDRTNMGLQNFTYTTSGADNSGTCTGTAAGCHDTTRNTWAHKWMATPANYTSATLSCGGCHGDWLNGWNTGVDHRTTAGTQSTHGGTGTYDCKDCHNLESVAGNYTFTFGTTDWFPLNATSEHGNNSIEVNSTGTTYNQTSGLCTACHSTSDGVHNFVDTTWTIANQVGDAIVVACGSCHTGGVRPAANSGAHAAHGVDATDLVAGGAACVDCHGNNGGSNYQSTLAGTHGSGSVNFATASPTTVVYSTAVRNDVTGTCRTSDCHNRNTVADQSTAWNTTALACDDCHYYSLTPTLAGNNAHGRPLSATHNDHFTRGKLCTQCHGTDPVASDTTHISVVTTLTDKAVALQDEASLVWTHASAVTDYTFDDTGNTCYTATNSGLGCHASAGDAGAADPTRPDWDVAFADCTSYCHSNKTDTASNPTSGLHGVVPSITGEQHDESFAGATKGCADCHNVAALATHQNGAFTGNGSVAGDRTNMGLQNFTYATSGADNSGTCTGTAAGCHDTTRNTWAHEWMATPANYQSATASCGGCHGDWVNGWNTGVDHRTTANTQSIHGGTGTYDCKDCHNLESVAGNYTFTFGTTDWFPLNATSEHGNSSIEINSTGTSYNTTTNVCTGCHSVDGTHEFVDTTWAIAGNVGDAIVVACTSCHASAGTAPRVTSTSTHVWRGKNATYNTFNLCTDCHPGGSRGLMHQKNGDANVVLIPENTTIGVDYPNTTYTTYSGDAGIVLGGNFTTGTTEAEICWNCHNNATYNTTAISEWGTNTDTNGAQFPNYNFGTLSGGTPAGDWLTSNWASAVTYFSYKNGKLVDKPKYSASTGTTKTVVTNGGSIHSVNSAQTAPGVAALFTAGGGTAAGARALIRCSYCHDVHGAWTAAKMAGGKSPGGKPYLRGKWMGSPYREDGAPSAGQTAFPSLTYFGPVPRPTTLGTQVGGYQIDQNQGFTGGTVPYLNTTTWSAMNSAELCALCHAGGGTWATANSLDTINQFGTASTDWGIGRSGSMNGHSNVVIGGAAASTTYSFNLYKEVNRHPVASPYTTVSGTTSSSYRGAALMVQQQISTTTNGSNPGGYSFRSQDSGGYRAQPQISGSTPRPWGSSRTWGVALNDTQNQANYHKFPCSKCHNPHASRLPRLLITNCLDTRNNTWDDNYSGVTTQTGVAAENQNVRPSNWTAAMNCHRRRDSTFNKTWTGGPAIGADGWNALTPWW